MLRSAIGPQGAAAMVLFGQVLDGEAAERAGLVWRVIADEDLLEEAVTMAARAASGPKPLAAGIKESLRDMASVTEHGTAVESELARQVWSTQQDWFTERIAAVRSRVSSR
jgi:enoyl-CoA hydratase